jgi:hypothetical protein
MIIQTAPPNHPHLVIHQIDHAAMSGQFAAVFGNNEFASLMPYEPMVYVATHHDDGWAAVDARAEMDANTGLPYHLTQTPLPYLLETSVASPDANEQHHPYSGLLSSMHTYGLFHGRYGLSDKVYINLVPAEHKTAVTNMLDAELARQERLKALLNADKGRYPFSGDVIFFHNYKLLQFFDTLALYFHMVHPAARTESQFLNVPRDLADDMTVTIRPQNDNRYALSPYPFREPEIAFHYHGRYLSPQPPGTDLKAMLAEIEPVVEEVILIAG